MKPGSLIEYNSSDPSAVEVPKYFEGVSFAQAAEVIHATNLILDLYSTGDNESIDDILTGMQDEKMQSLLARFLSERKVALSIRQH